MNEQEIKLANEYMNYLFNSKELIKARTRNVLIWDEGGYVNWLVFKLVMFQYFDTDKFTDEQFELIDKFQKSVEGKDGHDRHYDFYGNALINIHGAMKNVTP